MTLSARLTELIEACFTGLWIQSQEQDEAVAELASLCRDQHWRFVTWDIDQGLSVGHRPLADDTARSNDPLSAIRSLPGLAAEGETALFVFKNLHRFLQSAEVVQTLAHQIVAGKQQRAFFIVLAPVLQLPPELEKLFVVVQHDLPRREQLLEIARGLIHSDAELPAGEDQERLLDAAAGLTRYEAEGAFSLSLVRHDRLETATVWELKAQTLLKSGLASLYRGAECFQELGGLDSLKAFCLRALRPRPSKKYRPQARGVLLLGVPGTGKSAFAKALGNETGRPTLVLDVGSLLGSLVGQTEERTRQALAIADAMAPCVLMIDEVEKALSGATASGQTDSGVSARMFGSVLSWLNDHTSDVFVICTANDVTRLPPEFSRAERFDGLFFLDLPSRSQKDRIWQMYAERYGLEVPQRRPPDEQWTGAEIKSCCRLASLLDVPLPEAGRNVVPIAATAAEPLAKLRAWASGRCLCAESAQIYQQPAAARPKRRLQGHSEN
jgi:hypothetical protein